MAAISPNRQCSGLLTLESQDRSVLVPLILGDLNSSEYLFTTKEWEQNPLYKIAAKNGVTDALYLWIRCSPNELWVVCIRRTDLDEPFNAEDRERLERFANLFLGLKDIWHAEGLALLTERQQEVVRLTAGGLSAKQVASALHISRRTVEKHLEDCRKQFDEKTTAAMIAKLQP